MQLQKNECFLLYCSSNPILPPTRRTKLSWTPEEEEFLRVHIRCHFLTFVVLDNLISEISFTVGYFGTICYYGVTCDGMVSKRVFGSVSNLCWFYSTHLVISLPNFSSIKAFELNLSKSSWQLSLGSAFACAGGSS